MPSNHVHVVFGDDMSKDRNSWDRRRRTFDGPQDMMEPAWRPPSSPSSAPRSPRPPLASGPEVGATVKWFKAEKGFGFVTLDDGTGDAFLPGRAVEAAGYDNLESGTTLVVRTAAGQKGTQVTEIVSVDTSTAEPRRPGGFGGGAGAGGGGGFRRPDAGPSEEQTGVVRWFNVEKGFGFVQADGGGKDVFVHGSVLRRSGINDLQEGQRIRMRVIQGQKGPQAESVTLEP